MIQFLYFVFSLAKYFVDLVDFTVQMILNLIHYVAYNLRNMYLGHIRDEMCALIY